MLADFSLIVIRGGSTIHNQQELMKFLYSVLTLMNATEVTADEFDTSYDMIPRVVIEHSKELRDIQDKINRGELEAKSVHMKDIKMKTHDTHEKTIPHFRKKVDPRYGIIDAHHIDTDAGKVLVLNIAINTMMDMRIKSWLNMGICRKLNVGKSHDTIGVITDINNSKQVEIFETSSLQNREFKRSVIGVDNSSALTRYKEVSGIDVGKLIQLMDKNIDATDAPRIIQEINILLRRLYDSIEFMRQGDFDLPSIKATEEEMEEMIKVRNNYARLMSFKPEMLSIYFKLNSPDSVANIIKKISKEDTLELEKLKNVSEM
jgi:hypothetical protein